MDSIPEVTDESVDYSIQDKILLISFIILIFLELRYMWTWCQWFTNCPR